MVGVAPFALIAGFAGVDAGVSQVQTVAFSVLVFAGAAQLAALELIGRDGATAVVVATALVINARFLMYSASLAPSLRGLGTGRRALVAYLLTDQAFVVSALRYEQREEPPGTRLAYFLGAAVPLWIEWQAGTVVGAVAGAAVPASWSLDFAIPLVFLALLVPAVRDRAGVAAAGVAAVVAVAAGGLRFNSGLLLAAVAGIAAGYVVASK